MSAFSKSFISGSPEETEGFAEIMAKLLKSGDVIALRGGMGAGKTAFVRGLAKGMGVLGEVSSPTFTIVNEYPGKLSLFHFDMYRISDVDELYTTGFFDYMDTPGVCVVEWSENITWALPENSIYVDISVLSDTSREIKVTGDERFENIGD